ncbi:MAG: hypothetical protein WCK86_15885, partial [Planctomycetia bacterium]
GSMVIPGFELEGTFELINNSDVISISLDASFQAFDFLFLQASGTVSLVKGQNPGLVMNVAASLKSGVLGVSKVFSMEATFQLKVNTRSGSGSDGYDASVPRGMVRIDIGGAISLLGTLKMQASGYIESYLGIFRLQINGSMEILGQNVYGSGYFSSEGEFQLNLGGSLQIGVSGFGVFGSASFSISRLDNNGTQPFGDGNYLTNVYGNVQGSVELFGLSLASASISFGLDGASGRVYITPRIEINLVFTKIVISATFTLFYIQVPKPFYLAGNADDTVGTGFRRGVLYLNMGRRGLLRNEAEEENNEGFIVTRIAKDPDYPGEIVQVQAFGLSQRFRGVTGIVADGDDGFDYIKIEPRLTVPVQLTGGDSRDWLLHYGSGEAILNGGDDDDEILGGYGLNTFVMSDGFGRDTITSLSNTNRFDLSSMQEDLSGSLTSEKLLVAPSGYNRKIIGTAVLDGRQVTLLPQTIGTTFNTHVTGFLAGHGLSVGSRIVLSDCTSAAYNGEFTVTGVTADTFTFIAVNFSQAPPTGTPTHVGTIFHDGDHTAYINAIIPRWAPGYILNITSSTNACNGDFVVDRISDDWYSFDLNWADIRETIDTAVLPNELVMGQGNDLFVVPGDLARQINLFSSGGYDILRISGSLASSLHIVSGYFVNNSLAITYQGIERLELIDSTQNLRLTGSAESVAIQLGGISLGIVAQQLTVPVDLQADDLEVNVRDSLSLTHVLSVNELDLRVFGDEQGITVRQPVIAQTIQLVAPDGTVELSGGTQLSGNVAVIRAKQLTTESRRLDLSVSQLTLLLKSTSTTDVVVSNDRDLLLTNVTDALHLVNLDAGITAIFQNITWIANVAAEWSAQVFDGAINPYALAASGLLSITLPAKSDSGDEDTLTVQGGLRSWAGSITLTADEVDFLGGAGSVRAPGALSLKAATEAWTYRLGTSAETAGGGLVNPALAPQMLDLPTRDLEALADGFTHITIGRADAGNVMRLGDAFNMTTIKATGQTRAVDASIKDPISLLTDTLIVEGDFRAPLDPLVVTADSAEIRKVNLHTPNNSDPDSGLTGSSLILNLQTSLQVGGWLSSSGAMAITVPAAGSDFGVIIDAGSSILQTGATGSLSVTTNRGIRVAGQISTAGAGAAPGLAAGTRLDLLAGADVAATGSNAVLELSADQALTLHTGSTVRAGVTVDPGSGTPVTTLTGANGQISITTPAEMWLGGLVVSSGGLSLQSGTSNTDYSDLFNDLTNNSPTHYLADQAGFGLLLTGTILVQGAGEELLLKSEDDVILLGNVTLSGVGADLTVQSDSFVYVAGRLTVADTLQVLGGVALDGTVLGGADSKGSSIYLAATGTLNTTQAGASIVLNGAQDVDIFLPLIAGGTIGATGVTWAGDGSEVTVTAGQQIYLDAPIQAAAAIHLHPGTPGADDAGRNFIMTGASGLNAAGLGANNTGSVIRLESPGDLDIPANILSGGTIVQNYGAEGKLLSETYTWSGRDSRIEIVAGGKVLVGTDTVDIEGNPVKRGSFLRASSSVSILAGSHASEVGIEVYPNGGISTSDADGAILLDTAQSVDLQGHVVSGGVISLVQNAAGETTGYSVTRYDGTASLDISAGGRVRLGQEVYAGKVLTIEAGTATATSEDPFSGIGLLVMGSGTVRTSGIDGRMLLSSKSGISVLTPSVSSSDVYGLYASGAGSTITLQVPEGADAASKIYIGNRVFAEQAFTVNAVSNDFPVDTFELDTAGSIEVVSQSISLSGADSMLVKGTLISQQGSVTVTSAGSLDIRNRVAAGADILLRAASGDLTLTSTSRVDAVGTIALDASGSLFLQGPVGSLTAPAALLITAGTKIEGARDTGNLRSAAEISLTAPVIYFDGLLSTTDNTAAAGDYEVRITAVDELRLTGRFSTAGSVLIDSPNSPQIYNFTASQTGSTSRWKIQTTGDLTLGRLVDNGSGGKTAQGVQMQAVSELLIQTGSGAITVPAGSKLAVSGDSSRLRLTGGDVQVVGSLVGGASFDGSGQTLWTGKSASVELTGTRVDIGGLGPDAGGTLVTRGGLLQASGQLLIESTAGANSAITINGVSALNTMPTAAVDLAVATPTPEIRMTSAGSVRVYGVVDAAGTGADLNLTAQSTILLDGLLKAADQLIVSSASTAADSLALSQLYLKSNAQGLLLDSDDRLIDVNGYLINSDGAWVDAAGQPILKDATPVRGGAPVRLSGGSLNAAGMVRLNSAGGMNLAGQIGELSVVGGKLVSGTGAIQVRASGDLTVSGRLQASATADIRTTAATTVTMAGAVIATDLTHLLGDTLQVAGYVGSEQLVILSGVQSVDITGTVQSGGLLRLHSGVSAGW